MFLVKILKRKDASSVIVALLLAIIIQQPLLTLTGKPAGIISGATNQNYYYGPGGNWRNQYLLPIVSVILQILVLEVLAWIVVYSGMALRRKK